MDDLTDLSTSVVPVALLVPLLVIVLRTCWACSTTTSKGAKIITSKKHMPTLRQVVVLVSVLHMGDGPWVAHLLVQLPVVIQA